MRSVGIGHLFERLDLQGAGGGWSSLIAVLSLSQRGRAWLELMGKSLLRFLGLKLGIEVFLSVLSE